MADPGTTAAAELSSIATIVGDLGRRVTAMADSLSAEERTEEAGHALFEAERNLRAAGRAVERSRRALG